MYNPAEAIVSVDVLGICHSSSNSIIRCAYAAPAAVVSVTLTTPLWWDNYLIIISIIRVAVYRIDGVYNGALSDYRNVFNVNNAPLHRGIKTNSLSKPRLPK